MQFRDRARHGVFAVFTSAIAVSCVVILLVVSSDEVMQPWWLSCFATEYLADSWGRNDLPLSKEALSPPLLQQPGLQAEKQTFFLVCYISIFIASDLNRADYAIDTSGVLKVPHM